MHEFTYDPLLSAYVNTELSTSPDYQNTANDRLVLLARQMRSKGLNAKCVPLCHPYSDDTTGFGLVHPYHANEFLAIAKQDLFTIPKFLIFDCYGEISSFRDIATALTEFTSIQGHRVWQEVMDCGQARPDYYFMKVAALA